MNRTVRFLNRATHSPRLESIQTLEHESFASRSHSFRPKQAFESGSIGHATELFPWSRRLWLDKDNMLRSWLDCISTSNWYYLVASMMFRDPRTISIESVAVYELMLIRLRWWDRGDGSITFRQGTVSFVCPCNYINSKSTIGPLHFKPKRSDWIRKLEVVRYPIRPWGSRWYHQSQLPGQRIIRTREGIAQFRPWACGSTK